VPPGRHDTGTTDPRLDSALRFAVEAHAGQNRRDRRTPFIVHPLAVMRHLSTDIGVDDRDILTASLLHDAVEEAGVAPREIARRFGPRASALVSELTIPPEFRGEGVSESKKTEILLRVAERMTWDAILVKLAERWDNLGDMVGNPWQPGRRGVYVQQTGQFLEAIEQRWDETPPPPGLRSPLRKALKAVQSRLFL
jgi:guanosine-3',5'-bis(diphosphate) 3'-pyrophosphohydrolase